MATNKPGDVDLTELMKKERSEIDERRKTWLAPGAGLAPGDNLTGICLSGGGIRSACFNLGLLEGLDRLPYLPPEGPAEDSKPQADAMHLELFDYVSSVSGGSYAAGHLATAMLPPASGNPPEWLGKVSLTPKTVPNWLWGVGVWFLGVAFQLLKTGSLLIGTLALIAFAMRTLDSPDAQRFCSIMGLRSDVSRGFLPFWFSLGIFLVAAWINNSKRRMQERWLTNAWLIYSLAVVLGYGAALCWSWFVRTCFYSDFPEEVGPIPFWVHLGLLLSLIVPVLVACGWPAARWLGHLAGREDFFEPARASTGHRDDPRSRIGRLGRWCQMKSIQLCLPSVTKFFKSDCRLRKICLCPILVASFCLAGLVTTGDIYLWSADQVPTQVLKLQQESRNLTETLNLVYKTALAMIGVLSLALFFPKRFFKSAREVEAPGESKASSGASWFANQVRSPVIRVIVFLCSYGLILLVVFVLYSTMAAENLSNYYQWREDLASAAFHPTEFRDPDLAWNRIAQDAATWGPDGPRSASWKGLARRLMAARKNAGISLGEERREAAELRALDSMPWVVRLFSFLKCLGPAFPWSAERLNLDRSSWWDSQLYQGKWHQDQAQGRLARRIAEDVLSVPELYLDLPSEQRSPPSVATTVSLDLTTYHTRWDRYIEIARGLAAMDARSPGVQTAIRNNNRLALQLYLPDIMRDRIHEKVIFASIVWAEDQWSRLRVATIAGLLWLACCTIDVNAFSLQRFYRSHVIDSWVRIPRRDDVARKLDQTCATYRGKPRWENDRAERRAPLILFNATLEGNRSLGDEPDMKAHIFTFSPVAAGSGCTNFCLNCASNSVIRHNRLDIGNIVAASGAFITPGNVANPALSVLFHLLNAQTGYWVRISAVFGKWRLSESFGFHLTQSIGVDRDGDSRHMLTDGAHVENLGLYVLLQRRCTLIVASDCSQQEKGEPAGRRFDALIQVLRQAQVDGIKVGPFLSARAYRHWLDEQSIPADGGAWTHCKRAGVMGLDLVRPPDPKQTVPSTPPTPGEGDDKSRNSDGPDSSAPADSYSKEHYIFAQILYPGGTKGLLVYLRPTLTGDEGDGLLYRATDSRPSSPQFPDDDPFDQFYTPARMDIYRLLGRHIAEELTHEPVMRKALHQAFSGQTVTGKHDVASDLPGKVSCKDACSKSEATCGWNRPREFRKSSVAGAATTNGQHRDG